MSTCSAPGSAPTPGCPATSRGVTTLGPSNDANRAFQRMRLTRIRIKNFRSVRELELELGETNVFVGPNNAGKSAILDALRIALTRKWGQRGTGFTEHDVYRPDEHGIPKALPPVQIEVTFEEPAIDAW